MNVASGLSSCCKSGSRCCIYMHVASICFKRFQVFHTYVCKRLIWMLHMFAMVFKCFSGVFASVSDACFKYFICLLLYVATVKSRYFKSRSRVGHRMRMGNGRRHGRRLERCGPAAGALAHKPYAAGALASSVRGHHLMLASWIGRPGR